MNFSVPAFILEPEFREGAFEGTLEIEGGAIEALFDPDSEAPTQAEFDAVFRNAERFLKIFDADFRKRAFREAAEEITEESFEDAYEDPTEDDYSILEADLRLKAAQFFPDEVLLVLESPRVFPKEEIVVQLTSEFEIAEIYSD